MRIGLVILVTAVGVGVAQAPSAPVPGKAVAAAGKPVAAAGVVIPDSLRFEDGRVVRSAAQWPARRAELMGLFTREVFGARPAGADGVKLTAHVDSVDEHALGGLAVRKLVTISFPAPMAEVKRRFPEVAREMHVLMYTPAASSGRVPVVVGLNFAGNWTVCDDPGVPLGKAWVQQGTGAARTAEAVQAAEKDRGSNAHAWQVRKILEHGYGLATVYYGELEPDAQGKIGLGVRPLFFKAGQVEPGPGEWGALSVWAWGLSRVMDYLQTDAQVDGTRVAVTGHSRLGKTADWAMATDLRFAMLLSTESGKAGQSFYRRGIGEPIEHLWTSFPHWFTAKYGTWVGKDREMPAEGNLLLSLMAPRPVYVASAVEDVWSDPEGEFLSARDVGRVYALFGKKGLGVEAMPALDTRVMQDVAYHERSGKHDVTAFDWDGYLEFMDKQFGR